MSARPLRVVSSKRFDRSYKRYVGRDQKRKENVDAALRKLTADMHDPRLKTHALAGELSGLLACSREILLHGVGTHDEVY